MDPRDVSLISHFRRIAPLRLGWQHWCVLMCVLGALAVIVDFACPDNPVRHLYWWSFIAPRQQARYGFSARYDTETGCIEVTAVEPGCAFDKAGIQPGWVPWLRSCFPHNSSELFLKPLANASRGYVRMQFFPGGCEGWASSEPIEVSIPVPEGTS